MCFLCTSIHIAASIVVRSALRRRLPRVPASDDVVVALSAMDSVIGLVNRIQRACALLGDYGADNALPTLWDSLPTIVVVGGQVLSLSLSLLFCVYANVHVRTDTYQHVYIHTYTYMFTRIA